MKQPLVKSLLCASASVLLLGACSCNQAVSAMVVNGITDQDNCVVTLNSGSGPVIKASTNMVTRQLSLGAFDQVRLDDITDVYVNYADVSAPAVELIAPDNIVSRMEIKSQGGVLTVKLKGAKYQFTKGTIPFLRITAPASLNKFMTSGSGDIEITNNGIPLKTLKISTAGSGDVDLKGSFPSIAFLDFNSTGSGDLDAEDAVFNGDTIKLLTAGSGDAELGICNANSLTVVASGSGDVKIKSGEVNNVQFTTTGTGDIEANGLKCLGGTAEASGTGDIECSVRSLNSTASGTSSIKNRP